MVLHGLEQICQKGLKYQQNKPPYLPIASVSCPELLYFEHCYPVVFTNEEYPKLVALLGFLSPDKNLVKFTKEYPPTFASMLYPFVVDIDGDKPKLFCVEDGNFFTPDGSIELFSGTNPSEFLQQVIKKASAYANDLIYTKKLAHDIKLSGILINKKLNISKGGKSGSFDNFLVVDRQKLNALDDTTLARFAREGHLELIYMHLKSLMNINALLGVISGS